MGILNELKKKIKGSRGRLIERDIYQSVMEEIKSKKRHDGIWGQALAETEGNENKAKALYIKLRVESIKDEMELFKKELEKKTHEAQIKTQRKKIYEGGKKNIKKQDKGVDSEGANYLLALFYGATIFIVTFLVIMTFF